MWPAPVKFINNKQKMAFKRKTNVHKCEKESYQNDFWNLLEWKEVKNIHLQQIKK